MMLAVCAWVLFSGLIFWIAYSYVGQAGKSLAFAGGTALLASLLAVLMVKEVKNINNSFRKEKVEGKDGCFCDRSSVSGPFKPLW
jgi:hypothetical protein